MCPHKLEYEVCLVCWYRAYRRAGRELPEDVLLMASQLLQSVRDAAMKMDMRNVR